MYAPAPVIYLTVLCYLPVRRYLLAGCMYAPAGPGGSGRGRGARVRDSYPAVGGAAFGPRGFTAVRAVQLANLPGVGVVYLVLLGASLQILAPLPQIAAWSPHGPALSGRRLWTLVATLGVLPTVHRGGYVR